MEQREIACEYCGLTFTERYTAEKNKSTHKTKCEKKRYLGGALTLEFGTRDKLLWV